MEDQELYFQKIPKTQNRLFHPNQAIFRVAAVYVETPIATYWSFCGDRSHIHDGACYRYHWGYAKFFTFEIILESLYTNILPKLRISL